MTVNLRLSLTVFKVGFAAESASGFAALVSGSSQLPLHGLLVLLTPAFTALGILFLWIGRHEWNELHRTRVGHANLAFGVTILAAALAAVPVAYLTFVGGTPSDGWPTVLFGVAIAVVFGVTFVTYALVAAHLVGPVGEVAMGIGLGWAIILSGLIGLALSAQLNPIVHSITSRSIALAPILNPITLLDALTSFSYLAFLVAFSDAHYRVARGLPGDSAAPSPPPPRGQTA
jgi:hypothetical protein